MSDELSARAEAEAEEIARQLRTAYTVKEAARELRRSEQSIHRDFATGALLPLRIGGKVYVPRCQVIGALLRARGGGPGRRRASPENSGAARE